MVKYEGYWKVLKEITEEKMNLIHLLFLKSYRTLETELRLDLFDFGSEIHTCRNKKCLFPFRWMFHVTLLGHWCTQLTNSHLKHLSRAMEISCAALLSWAGGYCFWFSPKWVSWILLGAQEVQILYIFNEYFFMKINL